ncbi:MAG: hypothetical protein AAB688_02470 [Patescibacteria group bacterium]
MVKTIKNRILNIENAEKKFFWYTASFAIVFSGLYLYFVNMTIVNVVERQNTEKDIASLNSRISDMESDFLSLNKKISLEYAVSKGFVKMASEKYVSRKALSVNLSMNQTH